MNKINRTTLCLVIFAAMLINGCVRATPSHTAKPEPTSTFVLGRPVDTHTPSPTFTLTLTATPTATSIAACPGAPAITIKEKVYAQVSSNPPLYSDVRKDPGLGGEQIGRLKPGQIIWVADGPRCADGYAWWLIRSLDDLEGWTAEGDAKNYWLLLPDDQFFYDTDKQNASSLIKLFVGQKYRVTLAGTYSLWVPAQWTDPGVCIRGNAEPLPMFPSPGKANGPIGADACYHFARPFYGPCQADFEKGETISRIMFSTNGGVTYSLAVPVVAQYRKDHTYTYEVTGEGYPLSIRLDDSVLDDNYGQILVMIEKTE